MFYNYKHITNQANKSLKPQRVTKEEYKKKNRNKGTSAETLEHPEA